MSEERRQFVLGLVFLIVGLAIVVLACAPILIGVLATPRVPFTASGMFLAFLLTGVVVAVFGALLIPFSGAPAAVKQIVVLAGPVIGRLPGVSRAGDPPSTPPEAPV